MLNFQGINSFVNSKITSVEKKFPSPQQNNNFNTPSSSLWQMLLTLCMLCSVTSRSLLTRGSRGAEIKPSLLLFTFSSLLFEVNSQSTNFFPQSPDSLKLADLNGNTGFVINGESKGDLTSYTVTGIGDFNGDGLSDLIIGAPGAEPTIKFPSFTMPFVLGAMTYQITGNGAAGFLSGISSWHIQTAQGVMAQSSTVIDLNTLKVGTTTFINAGGPGGYVSVGSVPDLNGDNKSELLIGAFLARNRGGSTYLIWGNNSLPAIVDLAQWSTLNLGIRFDGAGDSGYSVTSVEDINGDTKPEILISARYAVYLIWGNASLHKVIDLGQWTDLDIGVRFTRRDSSLGTVASVSDINGDTKPELLITNTWDNYIYLIWGNASWPSVIDLQQWDTLDLGILFKIPMIITVAIAIAGISDINGDSKPEILIGAQGLDAQGRQAAGSTFLIWGDPRLSKIIDLAQWDLLNIGIRFDGPGERTYSGNAVASLSDINNDNKPEILIGVVNASPQGRNLAGSTYLILGNSSLPKIIDLAEWDSLNLGIRFDGVGDESSGITVDSLQDLNGDNKSEILIGANRAVPQGRQRGGRVYLIFGNKSLPHVINMEEWSTAAFGFRLDGASGNDNCGISLGSLADISGDKKPEIIIGTQTGKVHLVLSESLTIPLAGTTIKNPVDIISTSSKFSGSSGITTSHSDKMELTAAVTVDNTTPIAVGTTIAGMLCFAGLFSAGYLLYAKRKADASRKGPELDKVVARVVYERLNIKGVANFDSVVGTKYVAQIGEINAAYQKVNGQIVDVQNYSEEIAIAIGGVLRADADVQKRSHSLSFNITDETKRRPLERHCETIVSRMPRPMQSFKV